jgi:ankyrin repeat protein
LWRLLKQGINPDTKNPSGEKPLWKAADRGHQAVVHILLQTGSVHVDSPSIFGQSPIFPAAAKRFTIIVRLLVEALANTKLVDKYGATAYSLAKNNSHSVIIKLLEDH